MIEFLCCKIKPHSFFIFMNYLTLVLFASICASSEVELIWFALSKHVYILLVILSIVSSLYLILSFISFFYYIFADEYKTKYHSFYSSSLIFGLFICLALIATIMIDHIFLGYYSRDCALFFTLRWSFLIVLLTFILYWNFKLKSVIDWEENKQPLQNETQIETKA